MAISSYLDLYQEAGGFYTQGFGGHWTPSRPSYGWGGFGYQRGTWRPGATQKVVHDRLNNKYYGTQKKGDLIKGLEDSIKRTQHELTQRGKTTWSQGWMGSQNRGYHRYTAQDRNEQRQRIKDQQNYLSNIRKGNYSQGPHGSKFFDSYDDHTGAYNNIYQRTYNNKEQAKRNERIRTENARKQREHAAAVERNRLQGIENAKIQKRNQKIAGEEEATIQGSNNTAQSTKNKSRAKPLKPNLTVGTGIASGAYRGLGDTGLSL